MTYIMRFFFKINLSISFHVHLDLSDDRQLNESYKFPQRRLSTSTRFSYASQNLEHAELCKLLFTFYL